jgi:hypothetical protein
MARSPSATAVNCHRPPPGFACERCAADHCAYSVHYTEGSAIQGNVVRDVAHFTRTLRSGSDGSSTDGHGSGGGSGGSGGSVEVLATPVFFGCQTMETGMFYKQEADGIMGLQPPRARTRVPSMLSSLVQSRQATEAFSLCLADRQGLFLLGGKPEQAAMRARGALSVPMERNARARYTLALRDVRVSGSGAGNSSYRSLNLPPSTYAPTLVDSGTTFVYASTPLFRAIHAHVKQHTPTLQREGGKVCAFLTQKQLDAMPNMQLVFSSTSQPLLIRPNQYMVEFPKAGGAVSRVFGSSSPSKHYCVAVFDNQRGGTVIGASIMRHREVVFDIVNSVITFADANCDQITPSTSYLREAYTFAPCPPASRSVSSAAAGRALLQGFNHSSLQAKGGSARRSSMARSGGGGGGGAVRVRSFFRGQQRSHERANKAARHHDAPDGQGQ